MIHLNSIILSTLDLSYLLSFSLLNDFFLSVDSLVYQYNL